MAAIHGGHECNTYDLALGLMERIRDEPGLIAAEWTVKIIPVANPDGCLDGSRQNLNGVDLNRNWDTEDWTADAEGPDGIVAGSGGQFPFSEPETVALRDWFLAQSELYEQPIKVISYHSTVPGTGLAQPGYDLPGRPVERADRMARAYAEATGYLYSAVWVGTYTITGEFIYWASEQGLEAIDVELPDRGPADSIPVGWDESSTETNLRGLLAIMTMD
jgi:predicted deacylase